MDFFAAFGPLGTAELIVIAFLFLVFGGVTAAIIGAVLYCTKQSNKRDTPPAPTFPPPPPSPPPLPPQPPEPPVVG